MAEPVEFRYRAFISYSHGDKSWARWLHGRLEGFSIDRDLAGRETELGPVPATLRPVFRDREEFAAGHALKEQILAALERSRALVVICSPAAAKSAYVNDEVRLFRHLYRGRPVVPVIVAGEPGSEGAECFPASLRFAIDAEGNVTDTPEEVLAADVRDVADGRELALAKVVAGLLGVATDEIFRRTERQRERRQRRWIAGLSLVALSLAGLAVWAEYNRREAVAKRIEAERHFTAARTAADGLVTDLAQDLSFVKGVQLTTVHRILSRAENTYAKLVETAPDDPKLRRGQMRMLSQFVTAYGQVGARDEEMNVAEKQLAIAERLRDRHPGTAWVTEAYGQALSDQGVALRDKGKLREAVAAFAKSSEVRRSVPREERSSSHDTLIGTSELMMGMVLVSLGEVAEATKVFERSKAVAAKEYGEANPAVNVLIYGMGAHTTLATFQLNEEKYDEARKNLKQAERYGERAIETDPDSAMAQYYMLMTKLGLARVDSESGNSKAAIEPARSALQLAEKALLRQRDNLDVKTLAALSANILGEALENDNQFEAAEKAYARCVEVGKLIMAKAPGDITRMGQLAICIRDLGDIQSKLSNHKAALASYQEARGIYAVPGKGQNASGEYRYNYASITRATANTLSLLRRYGEAVPLYSEAVDIMRGLSGKQQVPVVWRREMSDVLLGYGIALRRQKRLAEALPVFKEALTALRAGGPAVANPARVVNIQFWTAIVQTDLKNYALALPLLGEVVEYYRRAHRDRPDDRRAARSLYRALTMSIKALNELGQSDGIAKLTVEVEAVHATLKQ